MNEFDEESQIELFWVDTQYIPLGEKATRKQARLVTKIEAYFGDNGPYDETAIADTKRPIQPKTELVVDQAIKDLIESSSILDDTFIISPLKGTNLMKSCHGRVSKTVDNLNESEGNIESVMKPRKPIRSEYFSSSETRLCLWKKHHETAEDYSKACQDSLITYQVPLVNGMDGRNINDTQELYQAVKKYKIVTNLIEKHVSRKKHIFNQILREFECYFIEQYGNIKNDFKHGNLSIMELESFSRIATIDLQQFIVVYYEAINKFYCLENLSLGKQSRGETLFNKNNVINFVTSLAFRPSIHDLIFDIFSIKEESSEQLYERNLIRCATLDPEDYGVSDAFCLNERTIKFLNRPILGQDGMDPVLNDINEATIFEEASSWDKGDRKILESKSTPHRNSVFQKKELSLEEIKEQKKNNSTTKRSIPYEKAIKKFKELAEKKSPIQKLKTIVKVAELINEAVSEFYKSLGATTEDKLFGDEIMSIFMYIIGKSQIKNLKMHCDIIQKFSTSNVLSSMSGYYAVTLEACVNYICEMNLPEKLTAEDFELSIKDYINSLEKRTLNDIEDQKA